ncbi:dUTP pyrophosphatase [Ereboglobus sp. PH5-5]|uniref:dUTP diphosphatase n=1 Tax=unclassified Ereboglobus TaxID=2626932 RepID=UPI0024066A0A|nr:MULTISPECIES: dUTP diphosphatase [unclassified Ereboglobus]MDF9825994.1 dUTP pyrophosphatase [Ereboglobus sp. PH5-10]MDF9833251.1 dUTP pyrophosphatase [Ereboglobus sp. PH5-5]
MIIQFKKLSPEARIPSRANPTDAGLDLYSIEDFSIEPGKRALAKTGLAVAVPEGHYGRVADRSGNAWKLGVHCLAGVVDEAYRGELGVVLLNTSQEPVLFKKGDRIAQFIIEKCAYPTPVEAGELDDTSRGAGGFGSTGK